ncbi:hypothetical protein [Silvanigrella aquatica]|uniref:Uncharacterized protein n=1 Tax=Silvanigrella aquatica TaxID=1915309 RepID=A0A1L4CX57_9BACT|nr:hypothetical protein [Silvanigrella aquatica]APJ02532.1 hypothetical protein AXG55_00715 [Silvanigrella aquatica]
MKFILVILMSFFLTYNMNLLYASDSKVTENLELSMQLTFQEFHKLDYEELLNLANTNLTNRKDIIDYLEYTSKAKHQEGKQIDGIKITKFSENFILNLAYYLKDEPIPYIEGTTRNLLLEIPLYLKIIPSKILKKIKSVKIIPDQKLIIEIYKEHQKSKILNQDDFWSYIYNKRYDLFLNKHNSREHAFEIYRIYYHLPVVRFFENKIGLIELLNENFPNLEFLYIEHENITLIHNLISGFSLPNIEKKIIQYISNDPLDRYPMLGYYAYVLDLNNKSFLGKLENFQELKDIKLINLPSNVYLNFLQNLNKVEVIDIEGGFIRLKHLRKLKSIRNISLKSHRIDPSESSPIFFSKQCLVKYEFVTFLNKFYKGKISWDKIIDYSLLESDYNTFRNGNYQLDDPTCKCSIQ